MQGSAIPFWYFLERRRVIQEVIVLSESIFFREMQFEFAACVNAISIEFNDKKQPFHRAKRLLRLKQPPRNFGFKYSCCADRLFVEASVFGSLCHCRRRRGQTDPSSTHVTLISFLVVALCDFCAIFWPAKVASFLLLWTTPPPAHLPTLLDHG